MGAWQNKKDLCLEDFPFQAFDKVRFADTDKIGHVNNAGFSTFLETGRAEVLYNPDYGILSEGADFVIAEVKLQYLSEINWPGTVEIGTAITRVGNSSIGLFQGQFQNGKCVATAETVLVHFDPAQRKGIPLSDQAREFLSRYLAD